MGINEASIVKTELELVIHTFIFILRSSSSVTGIAALEAVPGQEGPSGSSDTANRAGFDQVWSQITQPLMGSHW